MEFPASHAKPRFATPLLLPPSLVIACLASAVCAASPAPPNSTKVKSSPVTRLRLGSFVSTVRVAAVVVLRQLIYYSRQARHNSKQGHTTGLTTCHDPRLFKVFHW